MTTVCVNPDDFTTDATGRLEVKKGCGITGDTAGVKADVATWPYTCSETTHATDVYCDPTTGQLKGAPVFRSKTVIALGPNLIDTDVHPGESHSVLATAVIDLTDWCEAALADIEFQPDFNISIPSGQQASFDITLEIQVDGGPFTSFGTIYAVRLLQGSAQQRLIHRWGLSQVFSALAAGVSHNIVGRLTIKNVGAPASSGANDFTLTALQLSMRGLYMTEHN